MHRQAHFHRRLYPPYILILASHVFFLIAAFVLDTPQNIWQGFWRIQFSRSILITDYMQIGGVGATLVNAAIVGGFGVFLMLLAGVKPNGATIMALWLTSGFAFFGKNIFNMIPLIVGVWLYARYQREPFLNYSLASLLIATLCPVVSEISFLGVFSRGQGIAIGVLLGIAIGFLFPAISSYVVRVHDGYNLYSMGFAGGLIAMFLISILKSVGIVVEPELHWHTGSNLPFAVFLYILSAGLIVAGFVLGRGQKHGTNLKKMYSLSGRLVSDFHLLFEETIYINMGLLGFFATTLVLALGADLNGPTIAGIFTIIGFGSFGKHLKNCLPVVAGAVLCGYFNTLGFTSPSNILAILFSTGLAPIAGHFGWFWGVVAGFLHVNIVIHAGYLSNGLNLYNNGFAAGFVALLLVPVILTFKRVEE
ncbi:DUF1576 domain-containing protein (plasmid) [Oscillospiraceae bacterium MB08-C2-2]|nr:DUF1576 domain-containing protein [Oscillospiraceae bacterium MB08-C2-2]